MTRKKVLGIVSFVVVLILFGGLVRPTMGSASALLSITPSPGISLWPEARSQGVVQVVVERNGEEESLLFVHRISSQSGELKVHGANSHRVTMRLIRHNQELITLTWDQERRDVHLRDFLGNEAHFEYRDHRWVSSEPGSWHL